MPALGRPRLWSDRSVFKHQSYIANFIAWDPLYYMNKNQPSKISYLEFLDILDYAEFGLLMQSGEAR